ncbi:MAG: pirin family protein [Alphaproteobacteria bacterium]
MLTVRHAADRGVARFGWLDSRHSFSFGDYYDPDHMGFGSLRVINEDRVSPRAGFPTHGHRDMEIVTYVIDGALEHKDSTGTGSVIRPGDVQRMSAGSGIRHSEYNASAEDPVHFLQIWIVPEREGLTPGYEQKSFPADARRGGLRLIGSRDGRDGSVTIHGDVDLHAAILAEGETVRHDVRSGRKLWLQVVRGSVIVNGTEADAGDGLAVEGVERIGIAAKTEAEVLLFDMG